MACVTYRHPYKQLIVKEVQNSERLSNILHKLEEQRLGQQALNCNCGVAVFSQRSIPSTTANTIIELPRALDCRKAQEEALSEAARLGPSKSWA